MKLDIVSHEKNAVIINTRNPLMHIIIFWGWALIRGWVP